MPSERLPQGEVNILIHIQFSKWQYVANRFIFMPAINPVSHKDFAYTLDTLARPRARFWNRS